MNIKKERITVVEGMGRVYYHNSFDVELEEVDFAVNLSKLEKQIGSKILNILEINELIDEYQIKIETQNGIVELEIDDEKIIKKISNIVEVYVKFRQGTIEVEGEGFYDCKRKKIILENNSIRVEIFPLNSPGIGMVYQIKNCFGEPEKLRII